MCVVAASASAGWGLTELPVLQGDGDSVCHAWLFEFGFSGERHEPRGREVKSSHKFSEPASESIHTISLPRFSTRRYVDRLRSLTLCIVVQ